MRGLDDVEFVSTGFHALGSFRGRRCAADDGEDLASKEVDDGAEHAGAEQRGDESPSGCPKVLEVLRAARVVAKFEGFLELEVCPIYDSTCSQRRRSVFCRCMIHDKNEMLCSTRGCMCM